MLQQRILFVMILLGQLLAVSGNLFAQGAPRSWFGGLDDAQNIARYKAVRSVAELRAKATGLHCRLTGSDPIIQGPALGIARGNDYQIRGRVFSEAGGVLQIFVVLDHGADEKLSLRIPVPPKEWHEFSMLLPGLESRTSLRIDPPGQSGEFQLAWLNIEPPGDTGVIQFSGDAKELVLKIGKLPPGKCELVELNLTDDWSKLTATERTISSAVASGAAIRLPRYEKELDRQLHGFAIRRAADDSAKVSAQPIGWPRYIEQVAAEKLPDSTMKPATSKKGLQIQMLDDALTLGIQHASYNVGLSSLLDLKHDPANPSLVIDGEKFTFRRDSIARLPVKQLNDAGVQVYLILLAYPTNQPELNRLAHPARLPTTRIAAFNTADENGLRAYRACLTFLAQNFSGRHPEHGEVSGWVLGNEVNSHQSWYNLGNATCSELAGQYARALRVATTITSEFAPRCKVYVSLEHHWNILGGSPEGFCKGRELLDQLNRLGKLSGEMPWHVAYHPYPENLRDPRSWVDKLAQPSLDSPKITFKNVEQIVAYLKQPALQYRNATRRVILSEQGCDTPNGPDGETIQAAGYCYAWTKISRTEGIDAFIYHRHVDHRDEGGLRLGLWTRKPDSVGTPDRKKPIYEIFQKADTTEWERSFEFALPVVGVKSWDEVAPRR